VQLVLLLLLSMGPQGLVPVAAVVAAVGRRHAYDPLSLLSLLQALLAR